MAAGFAARGNYSSARDTMGRPVRLFHYHLVTSKVRLVEARYLGGSDSTWSRATAGSARDALVRAGKSWEDLDGDGLPAPADRAGRGAVNVVLQPGHWEVPRVDHLGIALDEEATGGSSGRPTWG